MAAEPPKTMTPAAADRPILLRNPTAIILAATALGVVLRAWGFPLVSYDLSFFVLPWYKGLIADGFAGIATNGSDYSAPYNLLLWLMSKTAGILPPVTAIKLLGMAGDLSAAAAVYRLTRQQLLAPPRAARAFAIVFLLPTTVLNSGWWGQSDTIYAGFLLWSIVAILASRPALAMTAFAVAFSIKPQAVFLLPFGAMMLLAGRLRWRDLPIVPATFLLLAVLPAVAAGKPALKAATIYVDQDSAFDWICPGLPNPVCYFKDYPYATVVPVALLIAAAIAAAAILLFWRHRPRLLPPRLVLLIATASAYVLPWLLPKMHERYQILAEMLAVPLAMGDRSFLKLVAILQLIALPRYIGFLTRIPPPRGTEFVTIFASSSVAMYLILRTVSGLRLGGGTAALPAAERSAGYGALAFGVLLAIAGGLVRYAPALG